MEIRQGTNTYIHLKNRDGSMENVFIFEYAKSGYGKSLAMESAIQEFHRAGYTVLILSDAKDEWEMGFAMFEPEKRYHKNTLIKHGKPIETYDVKLYHPFTFKIPKNRKLPEINFYGISFKDLHRAEWSMIAESAYDSDTMRVLLGASEDVSPSTGLYAFLHEIEGSILGKKERKAVKADPKNFYLRTTAATSKSLQDVASYLRPFKKNYFLVPDNSPIKLNWAAILNDNHHYHVFGTSWLDDKKLKQFCILSLLESIIRNKDYARKPVLVVIPEIRILVPNRPEGYKKFLAEAIKENLSIMRIQGKGMSGLFDSQVWTDVDDNVKNSSTNNLYGELGGDGDVERLSKARNYKREIREQLTESESGRNSFLYQGKEKLGGFTLWFPGHMHAEPEYSFFDKYHDKFPEREKIYKPLWDEMKKLLDEEENKFKEKVKARQKEEKKLEEEKEQAKEESKEDNSKVDELKKKKNEVQAMAKKDKQHAIWLIKEQNPDISWRALGDKFPPMDHKTAKKYYEDYVKNHKYPEEDVVLSELSDG